MNSLPRLLAARNSELGRFARCQLRGMRAALEAALAESPDDPAALDAHDTLSELDKLIATAPRPERPAPGSLSGPPPSPPSPGPPASAFAPSPPVPTPAPGLPPRPDTLPFSFGDRRPSSMAEAVPVPAPAPEAAPPSPSGEGGASLDALKRDFENDERLAAELGRVRVLAATPQEMWEEVQRWLLRASKPVATQWRERAAAFARKAGAQVDKSPQSARTWPSDRDELVYPGLSGSLRAFGKRFSVAAALDPRVQEIVARAEPLETDCRQMARMVSTALAMIREDMSLRHALRSLQRFRVVPLDAEAREAYERELLDRLRRLFDARPDPANVLRAWIDLDEAIHSLTHLPPAERDSWIGRWKGECRRALERNAQAARNAGVSVHLRSLWGPYSEVCAVTDSDLELDVGGKPGQVLACLRVYAKIENESFEGRVLYRSLR